MEIPLTLELIDIRLRQLNSAITQKRQQIDAMKAEEQKLQIQLLELGEEQNEIMNMLTP